MIYYIIAGVVIGIIIATLIIEHITRKDRFRRKIQEMMEFEPDDFSDSGSPLNR